MKGKFIFSCLLLIIIILSCSKSPTTGGDGGSSGGSSSVSSTIPNVSSPIGDGNWVNAICYSGYRLGQAPWGPYPSEAEIYADLIILTNQWKYIRMYDTGIHCERTLKVIHENNLPLKVYMGIAVGYPASSWENRRRYATNYPAECAASDTNQITNFFRLYNMYSNHMIAVSVGNECLVDWSDHQVPGPILVSYINWLKASNINIPVTVDEDIGWWALDNNYDFNGEYHSEIANACDFVAIHVYPLKIQTVGINPTPTIENALNDTIRQYNMVRTKLPEKNVVIGEGGWATGGTFFQTLEGQPNEYYQKIYYEQIIPWASNNNILFFFR